MYHTKIKNLAKIIKKIKMQMLNVIFKDKKGTEFLPFPLLNTLLLFYTINIFAQHYAVKSSWLVKRTAMLIFIGCRCECMRKTTETTLSNSYRKINGKRTVASVKSTANWGVSIVGVWIIPFQHVTCNNCRGSA